MFDQPTPTVSELVSAIKDSLEDQFHDVMVEGEISNLTSSGAGHWYFSISDTEATLSCALFKGDALRNPQIRQFKDGQKIIILGGISVYQKRGTFQLLVKKMIAAGQGNLSLQFEKLKSKLSSEGLFDLDRKRKIPVFPKKIAVITALQAAALADFLNVIKRRSLWFDIVIVPAIVQGDGAPTSLKLALEKAENIPDLDLIVVTRGGGSMEDLWCFNDESWVRRLANCKVPTISAVGHQVDFTLTDFVADLRVETPTAAAEFISQPQTELKLRIESSSSQLKTLLTKFSQNISAQKEKIHPRKMLLNLQTKVMMTTKFLDRFRSLEKMMEKIKFFELSQRVDESSDKLKKMIEVKLLMLQNRVNISYKVLQAVGPQSVLQRGYTYLTTQNGKVVISKEDLNRIDSSELLALHFRDGSQKVKKE